MNTPIIQNSPATQTSKTPLPIDDMVDLLKHHCVLKDTEVDAIVLWVLASYLINSFRIFPKLSLISPEKRCGKTTTMEVIQSLSKEGVLVSSISPAALFRITEQLQPTLLIDEADTFVSNGSQELTGLLNSSHTRSGSTVVRCVGDDHQAKPFSTWMPMVLASIGDLPDTVMDRSIVINLRRKKPHEQAARLPVDLNDIKTPLRDAVQTWCHSIESSIHSTSVNIPRLGNDRAEDNWMPLFTIAEVVGGDWPIRCERAAKALTKPAELELPTLLLVGIKEFFEAHRSNRVSSKQLVDELCKDATGPWQDCNNGKRLSQNQVAKLLRTYGIGTKNIRFDHAVSRGYEQIDFTDTFDRYLP